MKGELLLTQKHPVTNSKCYISGNPLHLSCILIVMLMVHHFPNSKGTEQVLFVRVKCSNLSVCDITAVMIVMKMCVGGEEQPESHLEEVHGSSPDILQQRPGTTSKGSILKKPFLFETST